jgi:hypothetical protein
MAKKRFDRIVLLFVLAVGLADLSGCASPGSPSQAVQWIVETEAQKKQLNDAGFPQYNSPG